MRSRPLVVAAIVVAFLFGGLAGLWLVAELRPPRPTVVRPIDLPARAPADDDGWGRGRDLDDRRGRDPDHDRDGEHDARGGAEPVAPAPLPAGDDDDPDDDRGDDDPDDNGPDDSGTDDGRSDEG